MHYPAAERRPHKLPQVSHLVSNCLSAMCTALDEKLEAKHHANMLHMMSVLEQEGPAFAERPISTLLGKLMCFLPSSLETVLDNTGRCNPWSVSETS